MLAAFIFFIVGHRVGFLKIGVRVDVFCTFIRRVLKAEDSCRIRKKINSTLFIAVITFITAAELGQLPVVPAFSRLLVCAFGPVAIFLAGFTCFLVNEFMALKTVTKVATYSGVCSPTLSCNIFLKRGALFFSATTPSSVT